MLRFYNKIGKNLLQIKHHKSYINNYRSLSSSPLSPTPSITLSNNNYKIGDNIHGYEIRRIEDIPELCLSAYYLYHKLSGAEHLHLSRDDSNNVFGVTFRTIPNDSTGVAHILEHLSLCGSNQYPCRDPFFKMLHRSLATFMNAFTGADYTMYPFATQNAKDYDNLLRVYLDAAFFPRLRTVDFRQEGWRLEHDNINDKASPIVIKGVVFNEMKGVFSSQSMIFMRYLQNKLFPSNTYSYESGGDPLIIPNLTHQQLKEFHSKHYHPSNARFYTYGNLPLESHLSVINDYLNRFNYDINRKTSSVVPEQEKWNSSQQLSIECHSDPLAPFPKKQTTVSAAYLLNNVTDLNETFTLSILGPLLMDGPNSPLYQDLIESGLGSDYSPGSGFSNATKQGAFAIGLQGIDRTDVRSVIDAIERSFKRAEREGFPNERIEALLHSVELSTKHQSTTFGLDLLMYLNPMWIHDGDPIAVLRVNELVENFRNELKKNRKFLNEKVQQYFVKNKHKLYLEMSPSDDFEVKRQKNEEEMLNKKLSLLSAEEKERIYDEGLELYKIQQTPEDLSVLPTLNVITDIPKIMRITNIESTDISGVPVQWSAQPTNGITYFHAIANIDVNHLPPQLFPYLPMFCQMVTKLGAGAMNKKQLDQEIQLRTGGLRVDVHVAEHPSQCEVFEKGILFSSYCLEKNIENMFKIWNDIFTGVRFDDDHDHVMQLIKMSAAELAMSVPYHGHRYAMSRAASSVTSATNFRELTNGLTSLYHFRKSAANENVMETIENLKTIASIVFQKNGLRCAINAEAPTVRPSLQIIERFIQNLPENTKFNITPERVPFSVNTINCEHHMFPFANNYLGKAHFCAQFSHEDYAKLKIASKLASAKYLHREIREKGGAYGGGAALNSGGVFLFYSYRDPHVTPTLDAFNGSVQWLLNGNNYSQQDIDEAKLSTFKDVDAPIPPAEQGMEFFINGVSDQMKHEYRMRLLDVSKDDIVEITKRYLVDPNCGIALIGPRSDITVSDSNWKIIEEKLESQSDR